MRVAEGVHVLLGKNDSMHEGWGANQGFVVTDEGVLVVDSGFTKPKAEQLLREISRVTGEPVRVVVNTHDHSDHTFGNSVFRKAGASIISHSTCRSRLAELGQRRISTYRGVDPKMKEMLKGLRITVPELTYEGGLEMKLGSTAFSLIHPENGAHTYGDTMVLLPEQRVLFAGDVLWAGYHPNLEDSNIPGWVAALKGVQSMDLAAVVPGHGKPGTEGAVESMIEYLEAFEAQFSRLVRSGTPKEEIASRLELPHRRDWSLKMIIQMNVDALYDRFSGR